MDFLVTRSRIFAAACGLMFVILVAGGQAAIAAAATGAPQDRLLEVVVSSGLLTVRANGVRLAEVLAVVGREAQVKIVLRGAIDALVSTAFADLPLDEGLRRLTRGQSIVMIYEPSPGIVEALLSSHAGGSVLREVWIGNPSRATRFAERTAQDTRSTNQDPRSTNAETQAVGSGGSTDIAGVLDQLNQETRGERLEALVRQQGEYAVVGALRETATASPSSLIRDQAIRTLESMSSPDAVDALRTIVDALRQTATTNPDPRSRREAVQGLAAMNGPEASDALRAALNDRHPGVAREARRALARWNRTGASDLGR